MREFASTLSVSFRASVSRALIKSLTGSAQTFAVYMHDNYTKLPRGDLERVMRHYAYVGFPGCGAVARRHTRSVRLRAPVAC